MANPTRLLAGPGRNWQSAIGSAKARSRPRHDKLVAEIAEMGDRPAEGGEAELEEDAEDFEGEAECLC